MLMNMMCGLFESFQYIHYVWCSVRDNDTYCVSSTWNQFPDISALVWNWSSIKWYKEQGMRLINTSLATIGRYMGYFLHHCPHYSIIKTWLSLTWGHRWLWIIVKLRNTRSSLSSSISSVPAAASSYEYQILSPIALRRYIHRYCL